MVAAMRPSNTRTTSMGRHSSSSTCIFAAMASHRVGEILRREILPKRWHARMRSISENARGAVALDAAMDLRVAPQFANPHKMLDTLAHAKRTHVRTQPVSLGVRREHPIEACLQLGDPDAFGDRRRVPPVCRAVRRRLMLLFALPRRWKAVE